MVFSEEEKNTPFLMEVEEAIALKESGVLVSGKVKSGTIAVGEEVEIVGLSPTTKRAVIASKDRVFEGTLVVHGLTKDDLKRGQVLATPGTMKPYSLF